MCEQGGEVGVHVVRRVQQIVPRVESEETIDGHPDGRQLEPSGEGDA